MRRPKDKRIELPVPFLKDKTAILLDEGTGWLYPTFYPGYKTIVLDDLVERLTPDLLQYMFPGQDRVTARDVAARIREMAGRDDIQGIRNSVHNLLDPYANNLNTCFSRIKRAFKNVVGDRIASFYYVDGSYAEVRTVRLDRDLVIWEH